jgi:hypothetical protein
MAKQLTLNQTINLIREISLSHDQIKTVYFGDVWEFLKQSDNVYPAMFYSLTGSSISGKNLSMNFSLFFLDRQLVDETNETDVLSDQLLIAQDIFAMFNYPKFDWEIDQDVTIDFFTENEKDYLAGVKFDITLNYPMLNDRCQVPSAFSYPEYVASLSSNGGAVNYVKFLLDYPSFATLPANGDVSKIYVTNDNNKLYRWADNAWIEISPTTSTSWGNIGGTLSNQTDLQTALNLKYNATNPAGYTTNAGTVTSVEALTLGTTGTDVSSTITTGTTTPAITLNIPTASATNRGALSSADWTTFNNKANALSGTTNTLAKFTSATAIGNSSIYEATSGFVSIGNTNSTYNLDVTGNGKFSSKLYIGTGAFDDSSSYLIINGGATTARGYVASANNYQDFGFVNTSIASGNINSWAFGQRRDTFFGNTLGSFQIVGSYTSNTGVSSTVSGGYRVPIIFNPNGDVIIAGASSNAVNGSVLIGTVTNTGQKLQVTGTSLFTGSVGIGNSTSTNVSLSITKNITSATTSFGVYQGGLILSDVTNISYGFNNYLQTQATTFTLGTYAHYFAQQATLGSGSTITNQFGFFVSSSCIGASNINIGFYSQIPAGTNRWNLYMDGTAQNYLAGALSIGVTTANPSALLQVDSTTKGFLPPRMTTTQKNAIATPATGLVVFDTTLGKLCVFSTTWQTLTSV